MTTQTTQKCLFMVVLFSSIFSMTIASKCPDKGSPVCLMKNNTLDLQKYEGKWYEIVRSESFIFGRGCHCSTAQYKINPENGTITVVNTCEKDGKSSSVTGFARRRPRTNSTCDLEVKFSVFSPEGKYTVVDTDYTTYSLVTSCPNLFHEGDIWLLSRSPSMSLDTAKSYVMKAQRLGFNWDDAVYGVQDDC